MPEKELNVELMFHTKLADAFGHKILMSGCINGADMYKVTDGALAALTAIRTCYSPLPPTQILIEEFDKYFGNGGEEGKRLFRHIGQSKHTSTLEHISFTFALEYVTRACEKQLVRHRVGTAFSIQSQRYVKLSRKSKSGGFNYRVPLKVKENSRALSAYTLAMERAQELYDLLLELGVLAEDARGILPMDATGHIVFTVNLRQLLHIYSKRKPGRGAQAEIGELVERMRQGVEEVEPWTYDFFEAA